MFFTTFRKLLRGLVGVMALTCSATVFAQDGLLLHGRVKVEGGSIDGGRVVVHQDGRPDSILTDRLNRFKLRLELNAEYLLSFEKEGFVTKTLFFNTHVPRDTRTSGFAPFEFTVSLFKQGETSRSEDFDRPVGKICYERSSSDFNYDSNYTKNVQKALRMAQGVVVERPMEENTADPAKHRNDPLSTLEKAINPTAVQEYNATPDSLGGPTLQLPDVPRPEVEISTGDRTSIEDEPAQTVFPDLSSCMGCTSLLLRSPDRAGILR